MAANVHKREPYVRNQRPETSSGIKGSDEKRTWKTPRRLGREGQKWEQVAIGRGLRMIAMNI